MLSKATREQQLHKEHAEMLFEQEIRISFLRHLKSHLLNLVETEHAEHEYLTPKTLGNCIHNAALDFASVYPETDASPYMQTID